MIDTEEITNWYHRFKQWQKQPVQYFDHGDEKHRCNNCGNYFNGDHCHMCGQKHTVGRITWQTVRQGVMDIWGMGNRSLPYTLLQLVLRPGYLIHDYISGKRQVSFPPVKMLFIVTVCCLFIMKWFFPHVLGIKDIVDHDDNFSVYSYLMTYYKAWGILYSLSFLIIPTWVLFRYAPNYPKHTLPEGFYIQIFIGTLIPLFPILYRIAPTFTSYAFLIFLPLYFFFTYKQLFGYGIWGTLWRMALMLLSGALFLDFTDALVSHIAKWLFHAKILERSYWESLFGLALAFACLIGGHIINKKIMQINSGQTNQSSDMEEEKIVE